jgi:hypothetical protein
MLADVGGAVGGDGHGFHFLLLVELLEFGFNFVAHHAL